jgi:hypothetical protein
MADGDHEAAQQSFIARNTVSVQALDVQMAIEDAWGEIQAVMGKRVIRSIRSGPDYAKPEKIFARMFNPSK